MSKRRDKPPIQSLDRGLILLEAVGNARRPMSLRELNEYIKIDRSNIFRIAETLRRRGFLAHTSGGKDYVLGPAIWRLSRLFPWSQTLTQIARNYIVSLANETGETVNLAVLEGDRALVVDHAQSRQIVGVAGRSGHYKPLYCTAIGKALIADYGEQELKSLLGDQPLEAHTKQTIRTVEALAKECEWIRSKGYAVDEREYHEDVRCVAAPIRDASGSIVASLGIAAPADRLSTEGFSELGQKAIEAANQIGVKLGYLATEEQEET